jgi:hypothetical protein
MIDQWPNTALANGGCSFILRFSANPRLRLFAPWLSFGSLGGYTIMKAILTLLFCLVIQLASAGDLQVDEKLVQNAVAVVRVRLMFADSELPYSPFRVYSVHTIRILKNESDEVFEDLLVRGFKDKPGVPEGESTIYLQRYDPIAKKLSDDKDHGLWILVGGDATKGVSNIEPGTSK